MEYTIGLGDLIVEAENKEEAIMKAKELIKEGEVDIFLVEER